MKKLCSEQNCFNMVDSADLLEISPGKIYEPSLKCWDCRTDQDRKKIKRRRKLINKKNNLTI
jgi:hypothetical protein